MPSAASGTSPPARWSRADVPGSGCRKLSSTTWRPTRVVASAKRPRSLRKAIRAPLQRRESREVAARVGERWSSCRDVEQLGLRACGEGEGVVEGVEGEGGIDVELEGLVGREVSDFDRDG